ncbi:hypothetical protein GJ496_009742 [Pomphorhynchus laevis]|nr:hypothetical protein GJ496_009742 [Pomphorhynchus laevis]
MFSKDVTLDKVFVSKFFVSDVNTVTNLSFDSLQRFRMFWFAIIAAFLPSLEEHVCDSADIGGSVVFDCNLTLAVPILTPPSDHIFLFI